MNQNSKPALVLLAKLLFGFTSFIVIFCVSAVFGYITFLISFNSNLSVNLSYALAVSITIFAALVGLRMLFKAYRSIYHPEKA